MMQKSKRTSEPALRREVEARDAPGSGVFWILAAAALVIRLVVAPYTEHRGDMNTFIAWGRALAVEGLNGFYGGGRWCDYLPGYLYVLWICGEISGTWAIEWQRLVFKIPSILADLGSAYIIWRLARRKAEGSSSWPAWAAALFLFSPAILSNAAMWGQVDSYHAFFILAGLVVLIRGRPEWAGVLLGYSIAVKPHAVMVIPLVIAYAIAARMAWWRILLSAGAAAATFGALFLPFDGWSVLNLPGFIQERFAKTMGQYPSASINALNLWYLLGMNWKPDNVPLVWGWTPQDIGRALVLVGAALGVVWTCLRRRHGGQALLEGAAIVFLSVFLFTTKAHERHVFPYLVLISAALVFRPAAILPYVMVTFTYCANAYFSWRYLDNVTPVICPPALGAGLCALNLAALPVSVVVFSDRVQRWLSRLRGSVVDRAPEAFSVTREVEPLPRQRVALYFAAIILFALCTRLARLNEPPKHYFDEVYHAYTARQWVQGNTDAWLWYPERKPDPGYAYEWTHPPLAKLIMSWSMEVFNESAWAWRLPAALFGTACVALIYLIARSLFGNDRTALLAATLASLDTLPLFSSRIGMNDIYCVTFILTATLAALHNRYVVSAFAVGLALSCKWTALYAFPFLGFIHLMRLPRQTLNQPDKLAVIALVYALAAPGMYLASHIPFFRAGNNLGMFVELQRQMWFYHTGLDATHPFTSPAWKWPMSAGAVWCHSAKSDDGKPADETSSSTQPANDQATPVEKRAANVWAMGNPVIWVTGIGAMAFAVYLGIAHRDTGAIIALAGYLAFWAPWLMSPRIMFIYHYLPSLPFLYLGLAHGLVFTRVPRPWIVALLLFAGVAFAVLYPFVTAIWLPLSWQPNTWRWG